MLKDPFEVNGLEYGTLDTPDPDDAREPSGVEKDNCCELMTATTSITNA